MSFRRELIGIDPNNGEMLPNLAFLFIVIGIAFLIICNITFTCCFIGKISCKDKEYKKWKRDHCCSSCLFPSLSLLFIFHCIRFIYCRACNQDAFNARFDQWSHFFKPLIKVSFISIMCTSIPLLVAQTLLLLHFPWSDITWMFAADSLIVTLFFTIFVICDIRYMEKVLTIE